MRTKTPFMILLLLSAMLGCAKEHHENLSGYELPDSIPTPESVDAQLYGDPLESVLVTWSVQFPAIVDSFSVYFGLFVEQDGYGFELEDLAGRSQEPEYVYVDTEFTNISDDLCIQFSQCDSLYKYSYFKITAWSAGYEGEKSERSFVNY